MVLSVILNDGSGEERCLEVDDVALCFFDTFVAAISPLHELSCFEYEDDEGDVVAVRSDEELEAMVTSAGATGCVRVFIKLTPGCISLSEIDDRLIMPDALKRLSLISSGNFGTLYKAIDTNTDQIIAVKCINVDSSPDVMTEVQRETSILKRCSESPYIVKFLSATVLDGELCLCMEFMDGGSLDKYGKLPSKVLAPVTVSIIFGLAFLWDNRVMHRDLKPGNILINTRGQVKLADFGVSKQLDRSITRSFVGTNAYMAPERLFGGPYRMCSDIWSLGLTLYEIATGKLPRPSSSDGVSLVTQHAGLGKVDLSHGLEEENCTDDFCEIVINCVIVEERKRWSVDKLINCHYVRWNTPVDQTTVAEFVALNILSL